MTFARFAWFPFFVLLAACTSSGGAVQGGTVSDDGGDASAADPGEITMEQVHVKDFVFDVRVAGPKTGEAVILLHGFPETSYEWRAQLEALGKAGYRAIAPDQRGYSAGARPPAVPDYVVTLLIQDVTDIADAMGVDRFHIVGHDWGAAVAWGVAKLAASRVITASTLSVPHPDAFRAELADPSSCQHQASSYFDLFVPAESTAFFLQGDAGFLRSLYGELPKEAEKVYVDALGSFEAMDAALNWYRANIKDRQLLAPELGKITVPTLFIWSDGDAALCKEGGALTANYVDAPYRFEIVTGVSHDIPELAPDKVNELLLSELSGRDQ